MSFYEDMRDNVATELIQEFGATHTFTRKVPGEYDPLSGSSTDTSKTYTAMAVKTEFSAYERNDLSLIHIPSPRDGLLSRMPSSA